MNILIPLGGLGKRFADRGYRKPKPMIRVLGKEILFWTLDSLGISRSDELYIPYNESLDDFNFRRLVQEKYPKAKMLALPPTRGASETIKMCVDHFGIEGRLAVLDGDTWYEEDIVSMAREAGGNLVACFASTDPNPIYSYLKEDEGEVKDIKEKQKISDLASSGCYVFSDARAFSQVVSDIDLDAGAETYTSHVISKMMEKGERFRIMRVEKFHVLGTPEQVLKFCGDRKDEPKRFCFDLDNTLVTAPRTKGDYSTVEPIWETINYLRRLKENGHTIIIYTARRMRTHHGNVGAVVADVGKITIETLARFGIPHDEIHFGKPYANFYIDDLMADPRSDLNKELGFYLEEVEPRHFNTVEKGEAFIKRSDDHQKLQGEMHYYQWVQDKCDQEIQTMFPKMLSHEPGKIELEMVGGSNFSILYLNELLQEDDIFRLISCLKRLHAVREGSPTYRHYDNFWPKLSSRLGSYDYKGMGVDMATLESLRHGLNEIAARGFHRVMIHGDPVLGNVLTDERGQIKFVDMRGIEGGECTVFGHELYDFAKVYQSLCGYDEVLLGKSLTEAYRRRMREFFESQFDMDKIKDIKTIAASLLLSLVPLHKDNNKRHEYVRIGLNLV